MTPWTVAHQAPLSTGFFRQETLPCPLPHFQSLSPGKLLEVITRFSVFLFFLEMSELPFSSSWGSSQPTSPVSPALLKILSHRAISKAPYLSGLGLKMLSLGKPSLIADPTHSAAALGSLRMSVFTSSTPSVPTVCCPLRASGQRLKVDMVGSQHRVSAAPPWPHQNSRLVVLPEPARTYICAPGVSMATRGALARSMCFSNWAPKLIADVPP